MAKDQTTMTIKINTHLVARVLEQISDLVGDGKALPEKIVKDMAVLLEKPGLCMKDIKVTKDGTATCMPSDRLISVRDRLKRFRGKS